jgi:Tol biopolymer transport system component
MRGGGRSRLSKRRVHDGSTQLTSLSDGADEPSWSNDDTQIVFHRNISVFVMNADGTQSRKVHSWQRI